MEQTTPPTDNYAAFYALLQHLPGSYDRGRLKRDIVRQFTGGRTESLREMTREEYTDALEAMRKLLPPDRREPSRAETRYRRSAVLHQLQLLGVDTASWDAVDRYCLHPRIAGKRFRDLDDGDLDALLRKLRAIRRKQARMKNED